MANTYTLINSSVLTGSQASVTFSSIDSSYTDLSLKLSLRSDYNGTNYGGSAWLRFNSNSSGIYSWTQLRGDGSSPVSNRTANYSSGYFAVYVDGANQTSNTFTNIDLYIPNYNSSVAKPYSSFAAEETNAVTAYVTANANLANLTSAITSIQINNDLGNWVAGSSFWLYGIKNS